MHVFQVAKIQILADIIKRGAKMMKNLHAGFPHLVPAELVSLEVEILDYRKEMLEECRLDFLEVCPFGDFGEAIYLQRYARRCRLHLSHHQVSVFNKSAFLDYDALGLHKGLGAVVDVGGVFDHSTMSDCLQSLTNFSKSLMMVLPL